MLCLSKKIEMQETNSIYLSFFKPEKCAIILYHICVSKFALIAIINT